MSIRNLSLWALAVMVIPFFTSCGGNEYIIDGLSLPAGAEVKDSYDVDDADDLTLFGDEKVGKVIEAKVVHFDSTLDWYAICGHIDGCLEPLGFQDSWAEFDTSDSIEARVKERMASSIRVWTSPDHYYIVELVNYGSFRSFGAGLIPPSLGDADYLMAVVHCNPEGGGGAGGQNKRPIGGFGLGK